MAESQPAHMKSEIRAPQKPDHYAADFAPAHNQACWQWSTWVGIIVFGTVADLLRPEMSGQRFAFESEDGTIFTGQVRALGIWRSFHTTYAGYFELLQRSIAAFASAFPLAWTPPIYAVAAAFIAAVAAAIAARCAASLGLSVYSTVLIGSVVLILPASGFETVLAMYNVEWYCLAAFVVFIAAWLSGFEPSLRITIPLVVIAGLTTPILFLTLPFVLPVAWQRRHGRSAQDVRGNSAFPSSNYGLALAAAILAVTVVQGIGRLTSTVTTTGHANFWEIVKFYSTRVVGGAFGGAQFIRAEWDLLATRGMTIGAAVIVLALIFAIYRGWSNTPRVVGLYLLVSSGLFIATDIILRPSYFSHVAPIGFVNLDGEIGLWDGRYMGAPAICLFMTSVLIIDWSVRNAQHGSVRFAARACAAILVLVNIGNYPLQNLHRETLSNYEQQVRAARSTCVKNHNEGEISIRYGLFATNPQWVLALTCKQAFGGS